MRIRRAFIFICVIITSCSDHPVNSEHNSVRTEQIDTLETQSDINSLNLGYLTEYFQRIHHQDQVFAELTPWDLFAVSRDSLDELVYEGVTLYEYPLDEMIRFYKDPPYNDSVIEFKRLDNGITSFIKSLSTANRVIGTEYGYQSQTAECFIDIWYFSDEPECLKAAELFNAFGNTLFPKTMSFASRNNNQLLIFRARYMYPSWEMKNHVQWFKEKQTNGT